MPENIVSQKNLEYFVFVLKLYFCTLLLFIFLITKLLSMLTALICIVKLYQLLGVIQSDLKWDQINDFICSKAFDKMWMKERLKLLGASSRELIDVQ